MTPPEKLEDAAVVFLVALFLYLTQRIQASKTNKKVDEATTKIDESSTKLDAAKDQVIAVKATADEVNNTLSSNNGGSTVRDKLDQIISKQETHDLQFRYIETLQNVLADKQDSMDEKQNHVDAKIDAIDKKVNDHLINGRGKND